MKHYEQMKSDQEKLTLALQLQTALENVAALEAQLAEAKKDSERLDWISDFLRRKGSGGLADLPWSVFDEDGKRLGVGVFDAFPDRCSLAFDREAIDSAIAARLEEA